MNDQVVTKIKLKLVEKYFRGRRKNKLINEYTVGEIVLDETIEVKKEEEIEIDFILPFELLKSEMDSLGDKNFLLNGVVKAAKLAKGVKSSFRLEAEAKVKGTALNPIAKIEVNLKR